MAIGRFHSLKMVYILEENMTKELKVLYCHIITEKYGAAFSMCSVLTNMPLNAAKVENISSRCGECNLCVNICPVHAILGREWKLGISREEIVDVHQCITCLKCLAGCRYSIKYLNS